MLKEKLDLSPIQEDDFTSSLSFLPDFTGNFVRKTEKKRLLEGPRKVFRLCFFVVIIPSLMLTIPFYARIVLYPPDHYSMAPTDQRLLSRRMSSVWCQGQMVHMNGSFNAYLLPQRPPLLKRRSNYSVLMELNLRDDLKEYWGFYLYHGSIASFSLCTRYGGGTLTVIKGSQNLKKCAWIGEGDSEEEDEVVSSEEDVKNETVSNLEQERNGDFVVEKIVETDEKSSRGNVPAPVLVPVVRNGGRESGTGRKSTPGTSVSGSSSSNSSSSPSSSSSSSPPSPPPPPSSSSSSSSSSSTTVNPDGPAVQNGSRLHKKWRTPDKKPSNVFISAERKDKMEDYLHKMVSLSKSKVEIMHLLHSMDLKMKPGKARNGKESRQLPREEEEGEEQDTRSVKNGRIKKKKKNNAREKREGEKVGGKYDRSFLEDGEEYMKNRERLKRDIHADEEDGAFEEYDQMYVEEEPNRPRKSLVNLGVGTTLNFPHDFGVINQASSKDASGEEERSSFSSSEEALASCDGVISVEYLEPEKTCLGFNATHVTFNYYINRTGTYYFVFSSDNELFVNKAFVKLSLLRTVLDTSQTRQACLNLTDCEMPIGFWTNEQTVLEVPVEANWNASYLVDSKCEPRAAVYLTFILMIPFMLAFCAFN